MTGIEVNIERLISRSCVNIAQVPSPLVPRSKPLGPSPRAPVLSRPSLVSKYLATPLVSLFSVFNCLILLVADVKHVYV